MLREGAHRQDKGGVGLGWVGLWSVAPAQLWIIQKELKGGGTGGEERCEVAQSEASVRPNTGSRERNGNDRFDLVSNIKAC